jgi:2-hydroxycyclohexanecarboxyl-CoA dehydrogenase
MKTLALEYARKGITVNTIPPFAVVTPNLTRWLKEGRLPPLEKIEQMIPAGRLGTPDDIAATCAFLCSDAASYITAQVISVNGGAVR